MAFEIQDETPDQHPPGKSSHQRSCFILLPRGYPEAAASLDGPMDLIKSSLPRPPEEGSNK